MSKSAHALLQNSIVCIAFFTTTAAAAQQPPNRSSYYWHPSLSLQDVSTERLVGWLARVGVTLPFSLSGDVSFSLRAGVPITALDDARAYELDGSLSSSRLTVQNIPLEDFAVHVRYRDGVMALQAIRFRLPKKPNETTASSLNGRGVMGLVPRGDVDLVVDVQNFDLARLSELTGADLQLTGLANGSAELRIAGADFADPAKWSGQVKLQATDAHTPGLHSPRAETAFRIANRTVTFDRFAGVVNDVPVGLTGAFSLSDDAKSIALTNVNLDIFGGAVRVNGRAPVGAPTAQDLVIEAENLDLAALDQQLRPLANRLGLSSIPKLEGRIAFAFDGTVPFQKLSDYSLWRLRRTQIRAARIGVGPTVFENITLAATFDGTNFTLDPSGWDWPAAASPDGRAGRVQAQASANLTLFGRVELRLQSTHTPIRTVLALSGADDWLEGFLDGASTISAPAVALKGNPSSLATWSAELDLAGDGLRLASVPVEFRRLQARWRSPSFEITNLDLALANSPIHASGAARRSADESQWVLSQLQLKTEFGRASAEGVIPSRRDQPTRFALRIEQGDASALSRILGPDVFSGNGPLNGNVNVVVAPATLRPRLLSVDAEIAGVLAGSLRGSLPFDQTQTAADLFRAGQASANLTLSVPLTIAGRTVTDTAVQATWGGSVLDVVKFGTTVDGIAVGGHGRAVLSDEALVAEGVELDVLGGKARGELRYPRKADGTGAVRFAVEGVDLAAAKPFLSARWPRMSGRIDAKGQAAFAASPTPNAPHPVAVTADLSAPLLVFGNWRAHRTIAAVRTEGGVAAVSLHSETLDGVLEWKGEEALPQGVIRGEDGADLTSRGSITLRNVRLGKLLAAAPRRQFPDDILGGRLTAALHYTRKTGEHTTGRGQVEVVDLSNRTGVISQRLVSTSTFDGRRLRLPDVAGDLLDGRLRGLVSLDTYDLRNGAFYRADVTGMSVPRFFEQIGADPELFTGEGDIHVRGRIRGAVSGSGTIEISRGTFAGLDVSAWRSPAEIDVSLSDYSGRFAIPQSSAMLAQGQMRGNVDYRWDHTATLNSHLDFTNVNLRGLLRSSSRLQSFGEGRVTGRLQLAGRSMRGLNDLTGSYSARLENTQPGSWPIFDQILSLLTGVGGRALVFDRGSVDGVIGGAAVRLNRMEFVSQRARLVGSGAVRFNHSLDLDVTAFTGQTSVRGRGGEFLAAQLLVNANPSTAVLYRINQLLSDRVIAMKVTGTISAPVTRIKPVPTLSAEAARFLLGGVIPTPGASSGR